MCFGLACRIHCLSACFIVHLKICLSLCHLYQASSVILTKPPLSSRPSPLCHLDQALTVISTKRSAWRDLLTVLDDVFVCLALDDVQISRLRTSCSARNDIRPCFLEMTFLSSRLSAAHGEICSQSWTMFLSVLPWSSVQISRLRTSCSARNDRRGMLRSK